ncbi:MAG: oxidoreductase [Clostridiales bacterium]|nr:MAG: oxidoreductase [Clostridiales bacterium]
MRKVKVGVIGCGGIANGKHMPALKSVENLEMVAFCDIVRERAEAAAREYGVEGAKIFEDYRELLAMDEIEVVHVCTPNSSHAPISIDAFAAGKHVYCEKPMAKTYADAVLMCEAAEKAGKLLSIGYQTRSVPTFQLARNLVRDGALGDIYYVKARNLRRRGIPTWGVFLDYEKQGGGPMIDIGTHSIDSALFIIDNYEIASVTGVSYQKLGAKCAESNNGRLFTADEYQVEDSAMGFIRFKNGCAMHIEASWAINLEETGSTPIIVGDKAGLSMKDNKVRLNGELNGSLYTQELSPNRYTRDLFKGKDLNENQYDMHQWISAVTEGTPLLSPGRKAAVVSQIIEAIYTSAETGKTVYFD